MRPLSLTVSIALACSFASAPSSAQRCGASLEPQQATAYSQLQASSAYPNLVDDGSVLLVGVQFHVIESSPGNGVSPSEVPGILQAINAAFSPANMAFVQVGPVSVVLDVVHADISSSAEGDSLRSAYQTPNAVDVFLVNSLDVGTGAILGDASFPMDLAQGVILSGAFGPIATGVAVHEVGHYFNLFHTHETMFGIECTDGSNGATAGDLVSDTPADPDLTNFSNPNCTLQLLPPPACGAPPYAPLPTNYMSFARPACLQSFTTGQLTRARAALFDLRPELSAPVNAELSVTGGLQPGDRFGEAVAIRDAGPGGFPDKTTLIVGAPGRDGAGMAFAKRKTSLHGSWQNFGVDEALGDGKLVPVPAPALGDEYGSEIAFDGFTALIGAPGANAGTGAVHVFEWTFLGMLFKQTLTDPTGAAGDGFGSSLAVYDQVALIGVPLKDGITTDSGAVLVYERDAQGLWQPASASVSPIVDATGATGDRFGAAVALSGYRALVGIPGWDKGPSPINTGQAQIYERDSTSGVWSHVADLDHGAQQTDDDFGEEVSLFGDVAVVGADHDSSIFSGPRDGTVSIFEYVDYSGTWSLVDTLSPPPSSNFACFGSAVSVWGTTLVIGASCSNPSGSTPGAGTVVTAVRLTSGWALRDEPGIPTASTLDGLGTDVDVSGVHAIAGAPLADDVAADAGAVTTYGVPREDPLIILTQDVSTISNAAGGTMNMTLQAHPSGTAGDTFLMLGNFTGTLPGIPYRPVGGATSPFTLEHIAFLLPLKSDAFFNFYLQNAAAVGFIGTLDGNGTATVPIVWPAGFSADLVGATFNYSYVLPSEGLLFASRPVSLTIVP